MLFSIFRDEESLLLLYKTVNHREQCAHILVFTVTDKTQDHSLSGSVLHGLCSHVSLWLDNMSKILAPSPGS